MRVVPTVQEIACVFEVQVCDASFNCTIVATSSLFSLFP
jgi:hypothetical protein